MYCCASPERGCMFREPDDHCFDCDYADDPNYGTFTFPEAAAKLAERGVTGLSENSMQEDVIGVVGAGQFGRRNKAPSARLHLAVDQLPEFGPLGRQAARMIWQQLSQPAGRFRRRSLSLIVFPLEDGRDFEASPRMERTHPGGRVCMLASGRVADHRASGRRACRRRHPVERAGRTHSARVADAQYSIVAQTR